MKKDLLKVLVLLLGSVTIISSAASVVPSADLALFDKSSWSWFPIVNVSTNQYHMWRMDIISELFSTYFLGGKSFLVSTTLVSNLVILLIGGLLLQLEVYTLLNFDKKPSLTTNWLISLISTLMIVTLWGRDTVTLGTLTWFPWMMWTIIKLYNSNRSPFLWLAVVIISLLNSFSANQLSPLTAFVAIVSAHLLVKSSLKNDSVKHLSRLLIVLAFLTPAFLSLFLSPAPYFPEIPSNGHLVPDDGLPGIIRPLAGVDFPIPVIVREIIKGSYSLGVFCVISFLLMAWVPIRKLPIRSIFILPLIGSLLVFLDVMLPEQFSTISPLLSFPRVLPGLFFFSLTPIVFAISTYLILFLVSFCEVWYFAAILIAFFPTIIRGNFRPAPFILNSGARVTQSVERLNISSSRDTLRILVSPSLYLVRTMFGDSITSDNLLKYAKLDRSGYISAKKLGVTISTEPTSPQERILRMIDERDRTRWSSGTGRQDGNEAILLKFPNTVSLISIFLDPGPFGADFPRGLKIKAAEECAPDLRADVAKDSSDFNVVKNIPSWQGSVSWSSDGFPYFTGQEDVRIIFKYPVNAKCLLIQQTRKDSAFDWSVAEIYLLTE